MIRYPTLEPFIANTDRAWFDFLSSRAVGGRVDEVNFWLPKATTPMKDMGAGETIFFRLKRPDYAIAGYGFPATAERDEALELPLVDLEKLICAGDRSARPRRTAGTRVASRRQRRGDPCRLERWSWVGCSL